MKIYNDHFVQDGSKIRAGMHIILDVWGVECLSDVNHITTLLRDAAIATNATILDIKVHSFGEDEGVTGIVLLAESHISCHTWPERKFAAFDVFTCGVCDSRKAIDFLLEKLQPEKSEIHTIMRGEQEAAVDLSPLPL